MTAGHVMPIDDRHLGIRLGQELIGECHVLHRGRSKRYARLRVVETVNQAIEAAIGGGKSAKGGKGAKSS